MQKDFKGVIFDLGNVIVDFNHLVAAKKISRYASVSLKKIYNFFFDSPLTAQFEEGKISSKEFFLRVKKAFHLDISFKEFVCIWNEIFFLSKKNLEIHKIIRKLKPHYKLILVSNINELHFGYLKDRLDIFNEFNQSILSYKIKATKPALKIYKEAFRASELSKEEVFYIDDRLDLIEKAREYGIESFCFTGEIDKLKNTLLDLGIK